MSWSSRTRVWPKRATGPSAESTWPSGRSRISARRSTAISTSRTGPRTTGCAKTLLQAPLAFYQKLRDDLSANADTGPETRAKLADAYFNLATIDRQIGSQPDALKAYEEAVVLLEPLLQAPSPAKAAELRTKLATVLHGRGQLQSDSKDLGGQGRGFSEARARTLGGRTP